MKRISFIIVVLIILVFVASEEFDFGGKKARGQNPPQQSFYPPTSAFKSSVSEAMDELLPEKIYEVVWDSHILYQTFFDSLDGWGLIDDSGGSSIVSEIGVQLHTGGTTNFDASIVKAPRLQEFISFDRRSRFRTAFRISNASIDDIEFNVTIGRGDNGTTKNHYGFRLENDGNLLGITADGSTESTVTLISALTPQANYLVEARFSPADKVIFYVSDANGEKLTERGVLTTNLPSGVLDTTSGGENNAWIEFFIETLATDSKIVLFSFLEYEQWKNKEL